MIDDEKKVEQYLEDRGLTCSRFTKAEKRKTKTPDFRVFDDDVFSFFCEVKTSKKDGWLDQQLHKVRAGCITGGIRNDPIFNRLTDDIHQAIKQFNAVNPIEEHPNVLAIVNHDASCGFLDLLAVLTGNFYSDDGSSHPIYKQFSEGRIKDEKQRIHAFIWIDEFKINRILFSQSVEEHHQYLCRSMGIDPESIEQIST